MSPLEYTLQETVPYVSHVKPKMNTEDAFEQFGQQFLAQFGPLPSSRKRKATVALESPIAKRAKGDFRTFERKEDSGDEWNGIVTPNAEDTSESGMPFVDYCAFHSDSRRLIRRGSTWRDLNGSTASSYCRFRIREKLRTATSETSKQELYGE